jgi:hypothetical protein
MSRIYHRPGKTPLAVSYRLEYKKNLSILGVIPNCSVPPYPLHISFLAFAGVMEKAIVTPAILIPELLPAWAAEDDDVRFLGRSRYPTLLLSSEDFVNFGTIPMRANRKIS